MRLNSRGFGVLGWLTVLVVLAAVAAAGYFIIVKEDETPQTSTSQPTADGQLDFASPKKSAHFESSTPAHGTTLPAVPADIVIDFNFDLTADSTIKITKDGKDYGSGNTQIDTNKLAMRRQMDKSAPDGIYTVEYNACWPDGSCHDGHHQFAIDSKLKSGYQDMRGLATVTIKMSNIKFQPMDILISAGTKVTWANDDTDVHYVNTDSHPAHTHVPGLNSQALAQGASYSFTFTETGVYPYHCSAHASQMTGTIVVES